MESMASGVAKLPAAKLPTHVAVALRPRPSKRLYDYATQQELSCGSSDVASGSLTFRGAAGSAGAYSLDQSKSFAFDHVFDSDASNEDVWQILAPSLPSVLEGFNLSVMAYGQTGSGKTHTMGMDDKTAAGSAADATGLAPRTLLTLFEMLQEQGVTVVAEGATGKGNRAEIRATFVEVYEDSVRDLLAGTQDWAAKRQKELGGDGSEKPSIRSLAAGGRARISSISSRQRARELDPRDLPLRETSDGSVSVLGAQQRAITDVEELMQLISAGLSTRAVSATQFNKQSSRSHAILTLEIRQWRTTRNSSTSLSGMEQISGRIQLVDLAGSERAGAHLDRQTAAGGESGTGSKWETARRQLGQQHFKQAVNINQGLLALAQVIQVLSGEADASGSGAKVHVPYRSHKLTRLLQSSLGGNSRTLLIACVSLDAEEASETLQTLRYAESAKKIRNTPVAAKKATMTRGAMMDELQRLRSQLDTERTSAEESATDKLQELQQQLDLEKAARTASAVEHANRLELVVEQLESEETQELDERALEAALLVPRRPRQKKFVKAEPEPTRLEATPESSPLVASALDSALDIALADASGSPRPDVDVSGGGDGGDGEAEGVPLADVLMMRAVAELCTARAELAEAQDSNAVIEADREQLLAENNQLTSEMNEMYERVAEANLAAAQAEMERQKMLVLQAQQSALLRRAREVLESQAAENDAVEKAAIVEGVLQLDSSISLSDGANGIDFAP